MKGVDIFKKRDILDSIKRGELINKKDKRGLTPLIMAIKDNCFDKVKILIKNNANVNFKDKNGWTSLIFSTIFDGNGNIVKILIKNNVNLNSQDRDGWTILMLTTFHGRDRKNIIKLLLNFNANVNTNFYAYKSWVNSLYKGSRIFSLLKDKINF